MRSIDTGSTFFKPSHLEGANISFLAASDMMFLNSVILVKLSSSILFDSIKFLYSSSFSSVSSLTVMFLYSLSIS